MRHRFLTSALVVIAGLVSGRRRSRSNARYRVRLEAADLELLRDISAKHSPQAERAYQRLLVNEFTEEDREHVLDAISEELGGGIVGVTVTPYGERIEGLWDVFAFDENYPLMIEGLDAPIDLIASSPG